MMIFICGHACVSATCAVCSWWGHTCHPELLSWSVGAAPGSLWSPDPWTRPTPAPSTKPRLVRHSRRALHCSAPILGLCPQGCRCPASFHPLVPSTGAPTSRNSLSVKFQSKHNPRAPGIHSLQVIFCAPMAHSHLAGPALRTCRGSPPYFIIIPPNVALCEPVLSRDWTV